MARVIKCDTPRGCVVLVAFCLLSIVPVSSQGWRTVTNAPCGLILQIPVGWEAQTVAKDFDDGVECSVGLRPSGWLSAAQRSKYAINDFAIYVDTLQGSLEDACSVLGLCRASGELYFRGRAGTRNDANEQRRGSARVLR